MSYVVGDEYACWCTRRMQYINWSGKREIFVLKYEFYIIPRIKT